MKFLVEFMQYHESFSGHDYCDGGRVLLVNSVNCDKAVKKAETILNKLNKNNSQSCWYRFKRVEKIG